MKKIVITGAAGLIGLNLLVLIDSSKYKIIVIDKNLTNLNLAKEINPSIEFFNIDLSENPKDLENIFENKNYEDFIIVTKKDFEELDNYKLEKCYEVLCVYR